MQRAAFSKTNNRRKLAIKFMMACLTIAIATSELKAQNKLLDSLENVYNTTTHHQEKIEILLLLSDEYLDKDVQQAEVKLDAAYGLLQKDNDQQLWIKYYLINSVYFRITGKINDGVLSAREALELAESHPDSINFKAQIYNFLGALYDDKSDVQQALEYQLKALRYAEVANNEKMIAIGSDVRLGGTLTQTTNLAHAGFDLIHNLNGTGDFIIQDNGINHFEVRDNGNSYFGGSSSWFQTDTSGTQIAGILALGDDGSFFVNNNGAANHFIYGAGTTIFNDQDIDVDFQINGVNTTNLFRIDASTDNIGVRTATPLSDVHIKTSSLAQNGGGGLMIESSSSSNNWRIYHSGSHFSFAENGVRRAYVTAATGAYVVTSDRNLKKNISKVNNVLPKLLEIDTYTYHYADQNASEEKTLGVMAQEIKPYFPELVATNEDGNLGMNYAGLSVVAIQAINEQQVQIDAQQKEIAELFLYAIEADKKVLHLAKKNEALQLRFLELEKKLEHLNGEVTKLSRGKIN